MIVIIGEKQSKLLFRVEFSLITQIILNFTVYITKKTICFIMTTSLNKIRLLNSHCSPH